MYVYRVSLPASPAQLGGLGCCGGLSHVSGTFHGIGKSEAKTCQNDCARCARHSSRIRGAERQLCKVAFSRPRVLKQCSRGALWSWLSKEDELMEWSQDSADGASSGGWAVKQRIPPREETSSSCPACVPSDQERGGIQTQPGHLDRDCGAGIAGSPQ